jgi:hypothetical protein
MHLALCFGQDVQVAQSLLQGFPLRLVDLRTDLGLGRGVKSLVRLTAARQAMMLLLSWREVSRRRPTESIARRADWRSAPGWNERSAEKIGRIILAVLKASWTA